MKTLQKFAWLISFCIFCAVCARAFHFQFLYWFSILCFISGLLIPAVLNLISGLWEQFGKLLGKIVSMIVLSVFFFVILVPLSLLKAISGKETIKDSVTLESNFVTREHFFSKSEFEKTW